MRLLALDQSSKISGYAVFENDKLIAEGYFSLCASDPIEQRLNALLAELNKIYRDYEFDKLVFEDIQLQAGNVKTFKTLSYVQAAIIIWCYNNDIKYSISAPSHWRSIIKDKCGVSFGRKRAEQKQAAMDFIKEKYNLDNPTEDTCDAICIGFAHLLEKKGAF